MEKRLIDANALKEELGITEDCDDCERLGAHGCVNSTWAIVCDRIESAPTIDAVPVVRCKDCKHLDPEDKKCDCGHTILWQLPRDDNWFCADGERRDDE